MEEQHMTNLEKANAIVMAFETGDPSVLDHIDETYIQHNLAFPDGKDAIRGFFSGEPTGIKPTIHRAFEDGDYGVLHSTYAGSWNEGTPQVAFDVFRFANGVATEHWDNLLDVAPPNPSGRTQVDGIDRRPGSRKDSREQGTGSPAYGYRVRRRRLQQYHRTSLTVNCISSTIHQWRMVSMVSTPLSAKWPKEGLTMEYDTCHYLLGQGDFVLTMADGRFGGGPVAYYDLFRLASGRVVEHWDIVAPIPAKSEWQNENGKF